MGDCCLLYSFSYMQHANLFSPPHTHTHTHDEQVTVTFAHSPASSNTQEMEKVEHKAISFVVVAFFSESA